MTELKIIATGSSPIIAEEIRTIVESFLGTALPLETAVTDEVTSHLSQAFYVCALTQGEKLGKIIPQDRLFVFDLHPTTKFFLDIAKIPAGSDVYVFNNLRPYTNLLAEECRQLGLGNLSFHSLPYAELEEADVCQQLRHASCIIGVDCLVENVLKKPPYLGALQKETIIIGGKRTASMASAGKFLAGIAAYYREALENGSLKSASPVIAALKSAAARLITSSLGTASPADASEISLPLGPSEELSLLHYLQDKFDRLKA